jgi:hypothetical protein
VGRVLGLPVLDQDWALGTLKIGGLIEGSRTFRRNCFIDEAPAESRRAMPWSARSR